MLNANEQRPICGIVMPISHIDGCAESHWADVLSIISDVAQEAGFTPRLVSNSDDSGIIQQRIIQNLYENPIAVCDVSCKNPNVMFELEHVRFNPAHILRLRSSFRIRLA